MTMTRRAALVGDCRHGRGRCRALHRRHLHPAGGNCQYAQAKPAGAGPDHAPHRRACTAPAGFSPLEEEPWRRRLLVEVQDWASAVGRRIFWRRRAHVAFSRPSGPRGRRLGLGLGHLPPWPRPWPWQRQWISKRPREMPWPRMIPPLRKVEATRGTRRPGCCCSRLRAARGLGLKRREEHGHHHCPRRRGKARAGPADAINGRDAG
mmetsp:Transcript_30559/g.88766  ORF Transcript_30559/g.88766 Transcript_30559/m.88766 type:complete len:207 (+) Transcript_30559:1510-2130(+)